jgi:lipopolysaccharide/colanic/teichoic acid biosynthesis glycosyltransferase
MATNLLEKSRRFKHRKADLQKYPMTPLTIPEMPTGYFEWKAIVDFCLALLLLLPGLPLMAIAAVLVRLTSRGAAIYSQCRVGQNGELFYVYKIRSMMHNAETRTGPAWTQAADPRVTPVGHFLRKFHLDELPQLFNVLKGEMSLVGPRPERPEFVEVLHRHVPAYANRLAVRPGITGLAQLNLPPDCDLDSVRRKVILDLEYIRTANLWLDLRLIVCTALRFLKLPMLKVFGIHRNVKLPSHKVEHQRSVTDGDTVMTLRQIQQDVKGHSSHGNGNQVRQDHNGKDYPHNPK